LTQHHQQIRESDYVRGGTNIPRAAGAVYSHRNRDRSPRNVAGRISKRVSLATHLSEAFLRVGLYLAIAAVIVLIWAAITTHGFTRWPTYWDKILFQMEVQNFEPSRARSIYLP
jgi:hypothetical protein